MNITKVHLTKVYIASQSKDGVPFISGPTSRTPGKPYSKISIKCTEHGDKYIGGFVNKDNENWKEGDTVDIIVKQNGEYLNFETPKAEDKLAMRVAALEVEVLNLRNMMAKSLPTATVAGTHAATDLPTYTYAETAEDLPF